MFTVSFHQFRCWENLRIQIPIGSVTLIKGRSGAGKTTILQGITWCLYGNIRLINPNHLDKAKPQVIVEFPWAGSSGSEGLFTINRQKNPNRLIVTHNNSVWEDKVAQAIIDDLFGSYDMWLASCYIGQGCRNNFLTAPNNGKMELLNSIAFHEEDPTVFIERIDSVITETDSNYKLRLANFTNNLTSLQKILETTDMTKTLTSDQVNNINIQIDQLQSEQVRLQSMKTQRQINIGILTNLQTQLDNTNNQYHNLKVPAPPSDLKYPDNIEEMMTTLSNILPLLQRRDQLLAGANQYDCQLLPYVNHTDQNTYTDADYRDAISKEIALRDSQRLAQSCGISYTETAIQQAKMKYRNMLDSQTRIKLELEYNNIQAQLTTLESNKPNDVLPSFPDITPREIPIPNYDQYSTTIMSDELSELYKKQGSIQSHIQHLQKGLDVIQCPSCNVSLRYQQGKLLNSESGPTDFNEIESVKQQLARINKEIVELNNKIQKYRDDESRERSGYEKALFLEQRRLDQLREQIKQLELEKQRRDIANQNRLQQIANLKEKLEVLSQKISVSPNIIGEKKLLSDLELDHIHSLIGKLNMCTILDTPSVSSQHINSCITYQNLLQKQFEAKQIYKDYLETIPILFREESIANCKSELERMRTYWNQNKFIKEEQIRLQRLRESLQNQINDVEIISDPSSEMDRNVSEINRLQELLTLNKAAIQAIQYHSQITKEREEVVEIHATLSNLQIMRQFAVETECKTLQQAVDSINTSIENVCNTLFDQNITIALNLFKTMKTTKNVKPVVNFTISYQGGNFDNINQMSGGEGDRASLALTLALNRLSSCPILMFDESLASLDLNMKEAAIRALRENTSNTVLVVMHDGVDGIFDECVNLDEITEGRY